MRTRDRGENRILIEGNDDPKNRNQYFEVRVGEFADSRFVERSEIVWVRDSRIAYNNAIKKHGRNLLNIYNLETGRMVVGATR